MSASGASSKQRLTEELRDLCEQFENIKEDAQELCAPLDDAQFNWRPAPKRWSISECLAHLNLADGMDLTKVAEKIERAHQQGITAKGPFRYGFLSRWFVRFSEPPARLKFKAPKFYRPPSDQPKDKVLSEFVSIHDRLVELVTKSNGLDLMKIQIAAPIRPIKFCLGQHFALLTAHDRRHLKQAWDVRKHPNFPV